MNKFLDTFGKLGDTESYFTSGEILPKIDLAEDFILVKIVKPFEQFGDFSVITEYKDPQDYIDFISGVVMMVGKLNNYLLGKKAILRDGVKIIALSQKGEITSDGDNIFYIAHIDDIIVLSQ